MQRSDLSEALNDVLGDATRLHRRARELEDPSLSRIVDDFLASVRRLIEIADPAGTLAERMDREV